MQGLLKWEPKYRNIYNGIVYTAWLPVVFALVAAGFAEKKLIITRIFTVLMFFYSGVLIISAFSAYVYLNARGTSRLHLESKITFLDDEHPLPDRSRTTKDDERLLRIAICANPEWASEDANALERKAILQNIGGRKYDACFIIGNIAPFGLNDEAYQLASKDIAESLTNTPVSFVMGKYDGLINCERRFAKTFMSGSKELYRRFDAGQVHIFVLNLLWDATEFSQKQKNWLVENLKDIPQTDTVIVLSHCCITSSGYTLPSKRLYGENADLIGRLSPLLEKYNVDFVASGHINAMEYLERKNISYGIVGSMASPLVQNFDYISPYSKWLNNTHYGWLELDIYRTYFSFTYYASNGEVLMRAYRDTVIDN